MCLHQVGFTVYPQANTIFRKIPNSLFGRMYAFHILPGGTGNTPEVNYNNSQSNVYRGGNDFTVKAGEVRIDPNTGLVNTTHGVSVDVNPSSVSGFGGAYRIDSLPDGLEIIQRGARLEHFEIVPTRPMPLEQFQGLLNQIVTSPVGG